MPRPQPISLSHLPPRVLTDGCQAKHLFHLLGIDERDYISVGDFQGKLMAVGASTLTHSDIEARSGRLLIYSLPHVSWL